MTKGQSVVSSFECFDRFPSLAKACSFGIFLTFKNTFLCKIICSDKRGGSIINVFIARSSFSLIVISNRILKTQLKYFFSALYAHACSIVLNKPVSSIR